MNFTVRTADLYEGCYYLLNGCSVEQIEVFKLDKKLNCNFLIAGDQLAALQQNYFQGSVNVDLFAFRRMYSYLNSSMMKAKSEFKQQGGQA